MSPSSSAGALTRAEARTSIYRGVELNKPAKYLTYDLVIDYEKYLTATNPKQLFAADLLDSLNTISTVKKI